MASRGIRLLRLAASQPTVPGRYYELDRIWLTWNVMFVIVFSIMYWGIVFVAEALGLETKWLKRLFGEQDKKAIREFERQRNQSVRRKKERGTKVNVGSRSSLSRMTSLSDVNRLSSVGITPSG